MWGIPFLGEQPVFLVIPISRRTVGPQRWLLPPPLTNVSILSGIGTAVDERYAPAPAEANDGMEGHMATVGERHPGGRPRVKPPSDIFVRVRRLADARGMHLDEVAAKAGIAVATLYQLRDPKLSTAKAIADALGVTVDRLAARQSRASRTAKRQ